MKYWWFVNAKLKRQKVRNEVLENENWNHMTTQIKKIDNIKMVWFFINYLSFLKDVQNSDELVLEDNIAKWNIKK